MAGFEDFLEDQAAAAAGDKLDRTFDLGGDNTQFIKDSVVDTNSLVESIESEVLRGLRGVGQRMGYSTETMGQFFQGHWPGAVGLVSNILQTAQATQGRASYIPDEFQTHLTQRQQLGVDYYTKTTQGYQSMVDQVWAFYNRRAPFDLGDSSGGSGSRGSGSRGPTEQDIRNQFDIDQLAEQANQVWRDVLLTDSPEARQMARSYVDAIVASKAEKKIDFRTFIRTKAMATDRFASIFVNKPSSQSAEQYLAPYHAAAMQAASPEDAAGIAIGGAQFGADSSTFAARLQRENNDDAPYINQLQDRMRNLNQVFKG